MRSSLKRWIKEGFKNPNQHKIELQIDLATLQSCMEVDEVTPAFLSQEKEMNMKILSVARKVEEVWRLKSRWMWLKGGDSNTKYFHKKTKIQQSFNAIKELKDKYRNKITGQKELKEHAFTHFQ